MSERKRERMEEDGGSYDEDGEKKQKGGEYKRKKS